MNNLDYRVIGKKIRERRKALEITQEQIAEYLDVNPSHISNIETGRAHPSLVALVNIANCLRCSIDVFISGEYSFTKEQKIEEMIISKLNLSDRATKEKILQIVNILL